MPIRGGQCERACANGRVRACKPASDTAVQVGAAHTGVSAEPRHQHGQGADEPLVPEAGREAYPLFSSGSLRCTSPRCCALRWPARRTLLSARERRTVPHRDDPNRCGRQ